MSNKAIYTPVARPAPRKYQVLLKGGPCDGQRIGIDSLARWVALPVRLDNGLGLVRYRRDPTADGTDIVYVFADEH